MNTPIPDDPFAFHESEIRRLEKELKAARKIVEKYREIYHDHGDYCNHFRCSCGYEEAQKLLKELDEARRG